VVLAKAEFRQKAAVPVLGVITAGERAAPHEVRIFELLEQAPDGVVEHARALVDVKLRLQLAALALPHRARP
jgi:hypothetical protein